jgi:hypothetical protein
MKNMQSRQNSGMRSSKHALVRANPEEAKKLRRISKEVSRNLKLIDVDTDVVGFENETNRFFNTQMDREDATVR